MGDIMDGDGEEGEEEAMPRRREGRRSRATYRL